MNMNIENIVVGRVYRTTDNINTHIKAGALVVVLHKREKFVDVVDLSGYRDGDGLWFATADVLEEVQPLSDVKDLLRICNIYGGVI